MTQDEIITIGYRDSVIAREPAHYTERFCYRCGARYALQYANRQFLELMEEWYGDEDFQDEREEMTRLFERRIGIEK